MLTFSENPGCYEPMGHFDASRSREIDLILNLDTDIIPDGFTATLYFVAWVINFIYISHGSAVVRYAA
jgi:hypothetical protein